MANKNKKKQQTGGLQPKGGAYANRDAAFAATDLQTVQADTGLTSKEKSKVEKQKAKAEKVKAKEKAKKERKEKGGLGKMVRETGGELKKVRWPSFKTTLKHTGVVVAVVVIFAVVVFGLDRGLGALYKILTKGL